MRRSVVLLLALVPRAGAADPDAPQAGVARPRWWSPPPRVPTPIGDIPAGVTVITRQDDRDARLQHADRCAVRRARRARVSQSGGPGGNASVFVRGTNSNHVLVLRDGMPINDVGRRQRRVQLRRRYAGGRRADRDHPRADGGAVRLRRDRRRDQPDLAAAAASPGVHCHGDLAGGYPAQIRGSVGASGVAGPVRLRADRRRPQSLRGYDTTPQRMTIYTGTPQGYRDRIGTLEPRLHAGGRHAALAVPARAAGDVRLQRAGQPDLRRRQFHRPRQHPAGPHRRALAAVRRRRMRPGCSSAGCRRTGTTPSRSTRAIRTRRATIRATTATGPDLQWNNTVHLCDLFTCRAMLSAADLTFGYEHTADSVKVRVNSALRRLRLPASRPTPR